MMMFCDLFIGLVGIQSMAMFELERNPKLVSISGLSHVSGEVGMYMKIMHNNSLVNLSGLNQITAVAGPVKIGKNQSLLTLEGLNSIEYIGKWLVVMKNDMLNDISALSNLKDITDDGFIMVRENPELSEVCIFSSLTNTKGGKKASMFNNKDDNVIGYDALIACSH
jgi:hypothetical protein